MRIHGRRPESGVALIAALFFALVLLAFASSLITQTSAARRQSRYLDAMQVAQEAAESGVELAIGYLSGPDRSSLLAAGTVRGTLRGEGERAPRYEVALVDAGRDRVDNDLDGDVDEADERDMLDVRATGSCDGVERTVRATLLARYQTPDVDAAAYVADPAADLNFDGVAFLISGVDVDDDGVATGDRVVGIGVRGDPTDLIAQIRNQQVGNVIGLGDDPSVAEVKPMDLRNLVEEGARAANVVLEDGGTHKPGVEGAWGTMDAPAIVFGNGDIHISGGAEGAGILIVNGNLTLTGAFEWRGLVIVNGEVEFKGGGGGKMVVGALVIDGDLQIRTGPMDDPAPRRIGLRVTGTVDIIYSRQIIGRVTQAFATYTLLNWREGPNPPMEAAP